MPDNDDYGFWDEDRDWVAGRDVDQRRRLRPTQPARRTLVAKPAHADPLRRRVTVLCAVALVAAMVAMVVRGTGSDTEIVAADAAGIQTAANDNAAAVELAPTTSAASEPPSTAARSTAAPVVEIEVAPAARAQDANLVVDKKPRCALTYTVRAGDYWIALAKASNVTISALLSANGASADTPMYPGDSICLPANATVPTPTTAAKVTTTAPTTTSAPTTTTKTTSTTKTTTKTTPTTATPTTVKVKSPTAKAPTTKSPTTTAAPPATAAPTTTAPPPARTYTKDEVAQIIRNVWPDDLEEKAIQIATRESNLIPTAHNSCCTGLFQIYFNANRASLQSWGIASAAMLYDPQVNALAAYAMYLRSGWAPWGG